MVHCVYWWFWLSRLTPYDNATVKTITAYYVVIFYASAAKIGVCLGRPSVLSIRLVSVR